MGNIALLDCTLRDGGYLNDWNFGHDNLVSIFERVVDANVEFIEVGFLDERREFDVNRSIMPDTDCVGKIYGGLERKHTQVVGMIDYGTCDISNIKPREESFLDCIRVIFKKHLRNEALDYCSRLKSLGYKVFAQLVSVTSYSDDEMMDLIDLANDIKPYAVSMVDTYGLMHQNNLQHYFNLLNEHLSPEICLGYHAHNNFQMGYANCITMISQNVNRPLLVDGTIYGMGKSAGNAPIELIAMYLNDNCGKHYQISQFLEAVDSNIMNFYKATPWGYNMFYYLSASNDCHPNYVSDLLMKRTLSVKSVNEILGRLEGEKKLLYDKAYMEQLYKDYQMIDVDDTETSDVLASIFSHRKILLLGPGKNIRRENEKIHQYIETHNPLLVSVNFVDDDFKIDYLFLTNSKRYVQLATTLSQKENNFKIIATSNLTKTNKEFEYTLNYSSLIDEKAEIIDNPLFMFLKALIRWKIPQVNLAGFDGYRKNQEDNYINPGMEYHFNEQESIAINAHTKQVLQSMKAFLDINFVTTSLYEQ
jgi:4-hydroxy 2-oxovalerate aldolase